MILNSPTISGSLTVTGNIIASGSITLSGSVASASYADTASFVALAQTASYVLTAQTASFVANAQTASFVALAQSASNAVSAATASFANAFTVAGTLTAQTLVVQTITSSVLYSSGSNVFGNNIANTQVITGSVTVTGSLAVVTNGTEFQVTSTGVKIGNISTDTHPITGSVNVSGSATFAGSVTSNGTLIAGLANGNIRLKGSTDGFLGVGESNGTLYLTDWTTGAKGLSILLSTGAATFSNNVTAATKMSVGTSSTLSAVDMWIHSNSSTNVNVARLALTTDATGHTASDGSWIHVESTGLYIDNYENDAIIFSTNTLERMRVTSNASSATLGNGGVMKLLGTSGAVGVHTELQFYTYNAPTNQPPVSIGIIKTDNGGFENGEFYIATKATNANTAPVERMRITSGGAVSISNNLIVAGGGGNGVISIGDTTTSSTGIYINTQTFGHRFVKFAFQGNPMGEIYYNGTNTSYAASGSDIRLKKNIQNWDENILDLFKDINPKTFNWNFQEDTDTKSKGFIAQEMTDKFPEAYHKGDDDFYLYNPSGMVVYLIKAIQELKAQNDALQSRIETLESK